MREMEEEKKRAKKKPKSLQRRTAKEMGSLKGGWETQEQWERKKENKKEKATARKLVKKESQRGGEKDKPAGLVS